MAARRRLSQQEYIYGSTVKAETQRHEDYEDPRQRRRRVRESQAVRRNQRKALQMDLPYLIMLTAAVACVLVFLVSYLQVQSSLSSRIQRIEALEADLERLKAENDALEIRINTNIDLHRIYRVATEELGMVYANRDQVLMYDKTESEYVRQYEDISKH